jgi:membrane protein required for colicin V production
MSWNWHDYNAVDAVLASILLVSVVLGIVRGLVREVLSLAVWILATLVAYLFGNKLAILLTHWIHEPTLRLTVAMAILFVLTLLVGALLVYVMSELVKKTGLTLADRLFGIFFGLARGVVIIMALTLYMPMSFKQSPAWHHSRLAPQFVAWESVSRQSVQKMGDAVHHLSG